MDRVASGDGRRFAEFLGIDTEEAKPVEYWREHSGDLRATSELLLSDPLAVMLDAPYYAALGQGVVWHVLQESLDRWACDWLPQSLIDSCPDDIEPWLGLWRGSWQTGALPIGPLAMKRYFENDLGHEGRSPGRGRFCQIAPPPSFAAAESAAGILRVNVDGTACDAFCLAEKIVDPDDTPWGDFWWASGEVRFCVNGDPEIGDLPAWRDRVREWWRHMAGIGLCVRGRPAGSTVIPANRIMDRLKMERAAGRARTQLDFAGEMGVSERTVNRYLVGYGGWKAVIRSLDS